MRRSMGLKRLLPFILRKQIPRCARNDMFLEHERNLSSLVLYSQSVNPRITNNLVIGSIPVSLYCGSKSAMLRFSRRFTWRTMSVRK